MSYKEQDEAAAAHVQRGVGWWYRLYCIRHDALRNGVRKPAAKLTTSSAGDAAAACLCSCGGTLTLGFGLPLVVCHVLLMQLGF